LKSTRPIAVVYIWPITHPSWKDFLGYSSLRFEPEIVDGDPRGWYTKVTPSAISNADQGKIYHLVLEVQTDDIAVDYAVVVGIKVTRVNPAGADSGISYIYVPVKASSLNNLKMAVSPATKEASPHSYVNFDVSLTNLGYYRDMFKLTFVENDGATIASSHQVIVLNPEESQSIRINILTPEKFFDIGTPNTISVYATSTSDSKPQLLGTIVIISRGIYASPLIGLAISPIILIVILIFLYWFFIKRRKEIERFGNKPEKPWNIPEEKTYLQDLKQNDKKAFEQEKQMMKDEYKSALLWYNDSIKESRTVSKLEEPIKTESSRLNTLFTRLKTVVTPKPKEKVKTKEKPKTSLKKTEKKSKEKTLKASVPNEDIEKEKILAKIRREQEKQLRKLQ